MASSRRARASSLLATLFLAALSLLGPVSGDRLYEIPATPSSRVKVESAPILARAAEAVRGGECEGAYAALEPIADELESDAAVLVGFYAHVCGDHRRAAARLGASAGYRGQLADWRLFYLASSLEALERYPEAEAALAQLVRDHPDSPLVGDAVLAAARLAAAAAARTRVLEWVELGQRSDLAETARSQLDLLGWETASELGDIRARRRAARRLLVDNPLLAAELGAVELYRRLDGSVPWSELLSPAELVRRAGNLVRAELPASALETLESVPEAGRDLAWHLARAEALVADRQGGRALAELEGLDVEDPATRVEWEWLQARAALEASTARRDRRTLTSDQRQAIRRRAHGHLRRVIEAGSDRELAVRAAKLLFEDLAESEGFEETMAMLRTLRDLAPDDSAGPRYLWQRGWSQYRERNYSGAIGYWTELAELYPQSRYSRSGIYWSARAHERLGNRYRSQALLQQVAAAEYTDFYGRHALRRLETAVADAVELPTEPWPVDSRLERARFLTDFGLDDAALRELDSHQEAADARAAAALRAVVLARQGKRRGSINAIWSAFPVLGTTAQGMVPDVARRLYYPLAYTAAVERWSEEQRVPRDIVLAMIRQESAFDPQARSWAGARGLMQVMPATGRELSRRLGLEYSGALLEDPEVSIRLGTTYFRRVLTMFDGDEELALAGYNGGPYRIKRLWQQARGTTDVDEFLERLELEETKTYVKRVVLFSDSYRRLYPEIG